MLGHAMTPTQRRRFRSKIEAIRQAEAEFDEYLVELNDAGVSIAHMVTEATEAGGTRGMSHSALGRRLQAAREAATERSLRATATE